MTLDRRVRVLGWLLRRATGPVESMAPRKREALRQKRPPRLVASYLNGRRASGVAAVDTAIEGPAGRLPLRIYRPTDVAVGPTLPTVVVVHGGGWMFGDLGSADWLCSHLAAEVPAVVVAATYRLAPEHPAPAAVEDALTAVRWSVEHSCELGGSDRVAVLGESSGGTLAATAALHTRDRDDPPLAMQVLVYPITDLTLVSPSVTELSNEPILTTADLRSYVQAFVGGRAPSDPYLSPLHAPDHRGLPPALILSAGHDPLRDDSRRYAERLRACGVPVEHHELADAPHGFFSFPRICRAATPALHLLVSSLRKGLAERS